MKRSLVLLITMVLIFLTSCDTQSLEQQSKTDVTPETKIASPTEAKVASAQMKELAIGETIYVPVYSDIFYTERSTLHLFATLSIRNTDLTQPIWITSVRYHNGEGKLVKQYLSCSQQLPPLASLEFLAPTNPPSQRISTNFIVEWAAESNVNPPIVESVMLSTVSTQGISFTSVGKIIQNQTKNPVKGCQSN